VISSLSSGKFWSSVLKYATATSLESLPTYLLIEV
jgi:hypothetical protein